MPPTTAELSPETLEVQDIIGGTCPLTPIQICILWSARQEKIISPLAFRVYFAAHEIKFWRSKTQSGEKYQYQPFGFQISDLSRLLPNVPEAKITKAFNELTTINVLNINDQGIWFAKNLNDVTIDERIKQRILTMFNQFHQDTRNKIVKIPRRILKLIVKCGRQVVRIATLLGMLLTTMLTKRTEKYGGYQGCCKAEWIGKVFGVNYKRINHERAKLINEGWFQRLPTPPQVRKKFGQWVRLNPTQPTPDSEKPDSEQSEIEELTVEEPLYELSAIEVPDTEEAIVEAGCDRSSSSI